MIRNGSKTLIIGAGASGLACAISLARRGCLVTVFEHKDSAGVKLSLTGNGKCNFTNEFLLPECYHLANNSRISNLLNRFTTNDAVCFFESIGIKSIIKNGYYYPECENAKLVVKALLKECDNLGVVIRFNCGELDIKKLRKEYENIVLACGSRCHKETGSNGTGYKFLESLGIKYTRVLPALCAVYTNDQFHKNNSGKRIIGKVSAIVDNKSIYSSTGEIQITDYGYSGIPVFQISRYISKALDNNKEARIHINFNPILEDIPTFLRDRYIKNNYLDIDTLVSKTASFDKAQVCTGGVPLEALTDTFELKEAKGIYVIGEMCDVDGICGGYNLHFAWLSANLCGL